MTWTTVISWDDAVAAARVINRGGRWAARRALALLRARDPKSPLRIELANVMKNIRADEVALDGMDRGDGCCTACVWGDAYWKVYERLKRRVDRANQLTRKLWYDAGNYGPVRPVWSSHA